ncbi:MAG: sugar phosphate isomerase/epimerase family protein [Blautia sp.]|jgi:D-psicose/D-tagatose/L-ribulose 3-epimerase
MKYGIYYAYWEQEWSADFLRYVDKVADLGFDILELNGTPLPEYTQSDIDALKSRAEAAGIELTAGYGPVYEHDMGNKDPKIRENALEWYKRLFAVMEKLDCHSLAGALYSHWPIDYSKGVNKEEDWKRSVEGMKILGPVAAEFGVDLNMEVLNRFENHILNTAEEGVKFVKEVDLDNVWVHLDTFHMNIEEDSMAEAIRTAGKYLGHFHIGECNRKVQGKGDRMPWKSIGLALNEIGYDRRIVMEPFVRMGGQVGSDIKVWRDISEGADEAKLDQDAKDALGFIKYMVKK